MKTMKNLNALKLTTNENKMIVPQRMWITFLNNEYEKIWMPLTDYDGTQFYAFENIEEGYGLTNWEHMLQVAREKFGNVKFGLGDCISKEVGGAYWDNF